MPVKLSGELVTEARSAARVFHRSLTGQIEHWAAIGRMVEARLSAEAVGSLLEASGGTVKIAADSAQRREVMAALAGFLSQVPDHSWLSELTDRGIPLYGTRAGQSGIFRRDPDGRETPVTNEPKSVGS